jgi:hypothetical protein
VVLSFSQVVAADFSFALGEAEPGAARVQPAAWVVPAEGLALACFAAALVADAPVAELVAGAAVAELALACSVAAPAAGEPAVVLAADAAEEEPGAAEAALAAAELVAGAAVELA